MLGTRGSGACHLSLAALWPNENVAASPRAAPRPCGAVDRAGRHPGCRTPSSTGSRALLEGAAANGFTGELWTLERIALVIERLTRVQHHPAHVWALLHYRLGWSVQRPKRRAAERDQDAIDRWVKERWPQILQRPTAQSLPGLVRRERAQPDPECAPDLGVQGPAADLDPPVQLEEGLDGGRALLWR